MFSFITYYTLVNEAGNDYDIVGFQLFRILCFKVKGIGADYDIDVTSFISFGLQQFLACHIIVYGVVQPKLGPIIMSDLFKMNSRGSEVTKHMFTKHMKS